MSRSIKKGPYVQEVLLKRVVAMNEAGVRSYAPVIRRYHGSSTATITLVSNSWSSSYVLTQNSSNIDTEGTVTPIKYSIRRGVFNCSVEVPTDMQKYFDNLSCYIMKLPEGVNGSSSIPQEHPEWVLGWKFIGSPLGSNTNTVQPLAPISVRFNKGCTLYSGDRLCAVFVGHLNGFNGSSPQSTDVICDGVYQFYVKAN